MNSKVHPLIKMMFFELNRRKLTLRVTAECIGVSTSTLDRWRLGTVSPTLRQLEKVAELFDCEIIFKPLYTLEGTNNENK